MKTPASNFASFPPLRVLLIRWCAVALALSLWGLPASACNIPVFRFALDRWGGDIYQLHIATATAISPPVAALLHARLSDVANVVVVQDDALPPNTAKLMFPKDPGGVAWSGRFDANALDMMLNSPARGEMARRLCAGDSGVWVLVEGTDAAANDAAAKMIAANLRVAERSGVLPPLRPDDPTSLPGPGPALAVRFSLLRIARTDPREAATVAMIDGNDPDSKPNPAKPSAALIFGRGHQLITLAQGNLMPDNVRSACEFLLGACSCEVKEMHPGWDMLMNVDWDAKLEQAEQQRLAASSSPKTQSAALAIIKPETVLIQGATPSPPAPSISGINFRWPLIGAVAFALAAIGGIWIIVAGQNRRRIDAKTIGK